MARTFKFSFPLPSRRQNHASHPTPPYEAIDSPLFNPGSKAERVLGTSDSGLYGARKTPVAKEKKGHKNHDYMSVTIVETDGGSVKAGSPKIRKASHASSPSRQTPHTSKGAELDPGNATEVSGILHPSHASLTSQSYYDSSKSPLSISQQTSASSARDLALRKGYPSVIRPPASQTPDTNGMRETQLGDGNVKSRSRPKHSNFQFGLSSRLQKADRPVQPVRSPNNVVGSPSPPSAAPGPRPSGQRNRSKLFLWERKKSRETLLGGPEAPHALLCTDETSPERPQNVIRSAVDMSIGRTRPGEVPPRPLSQSVKGSVTMTGPDGPRCHRLRRSQSSISDPGEEWQQTDRSGARAHSTLNSKAPPFDAPFHGQQLEETPHAANGGSQRGGHRRKKSLTVIFSNMNIHEHSFLALSSSDDENEGHHTADDFSRRHRIRARADKADTGEGVVVGRTQRLTHMKPRPVVNHPRRRISHLDGLDAIPPVPTIPIRPPLNPRISSIRWRAETNHPLTSLDTRSHTEHSRESSSASGSASRVSPRGSHGTAPSGDNKLMAVTAEEEKLLEAMRRKKASIRQEARAAPSDHSNVAPGHIMSSTRPQTAGVVGRRETSYFDRGRSTSPPRASGPVHTTWKLPIISSADDVLREDPSTVPLATPVSQRPPHALASDRRRRASTAFSDSGTSIPPFSFNPSDILPSTPSMSDATGDEGHGAPPHAHCTSPMTPPPGHGISDVYATGLTMEGLPSPSEPILVVDHRRNDPKRTGSSGVIVLGGTGQEAGELEDEHEMGQWALNRW